MAKQKNKNSDENEELEDDEESSEDDEKLEDIIEQFVPNLNLEQISPILEPIGRNLEQGPRRITIGDNEEQTIGGVYDIQREVEGTRETTNQKNYELSDNYQSGIYDLKSQNSDSQMRTTIIKDRSFQRDDSSKIFNDTLRESMLQRDYETERDKRLKEDRRR